MQFKSYTIVPKGRNKYGNYISAGNVTKQVITTTYAGNGTTTDINTGGTEDKHDEIENWLLFLSKTSNVFDGQSVAIVPVTDTVSLIGYRGQVKAQTYIGDISTTATSATYNITGITESGMSVSVSGNGTSSTTLNITVSSAITESSGKITIPCNVYLKALSLGDDISAWNSFQSECMTVPLEYSWSITSNASSAYILDLTNDSAGINCDSEGNILPGAIRPTCTARLFYGTEIATGVTYHISYPSTQQVAGVTIDTNTGILTFGSNFNFIGTALEITVLGKINGETLGIKIMTISKNIAGQNGADGQNGQDGQDGQDGSDGVDGEDGTSIIWQGTYSSHPSNPQNGWAYYNSTTKKSYTYKDGTWYQMTMDGTNGHDGKSIIWKGESANPPANPEVNWCYRDTDNGRIYVYNGTAWELMTRDGDDGTDGTDGTDGLSVFITYHDNAATNKPSKPTEDGTTGGWHTDTTPNVVWMSQKVSESASTGTWGEPIQIKGTNGANAITKWISLSANEVKVNPTTSSCTPSTITVNVFEQLGEQTPEMIEETVYWGYDTVSPITTITTPHTITVSSGYTYLTFGLKNEYDEFFEIETVQILKDGIKGEKGDKGDAGRQGAAMRGPVDWWKQETARRFCNGQLTDPTYPEDAQYIDIVIKDKVTYICTTSFTGSANDPWSAVSDNFEVVSGKCDFVATNILLADNASIDFTTTNALYLRNSGGTITAGAEGGNDINFWAGSDTPSDAPFTVNNDGTLIAKTGTFAGYIQMPYYFVSDLQHNSNGYIADEHAYLISDVTSTFLIPNNLILPEPSSALNGFTYHILAVSNTATKSSENPSISVITPNTLNCTSDDFKVYTFFGSSNPNYSRLHFFGGHIIITCMPFKNYNEVVYRWIVTDATGGVDCYSTKKFKFGGGGGDQGWNTSTSNSGNTGTMRKSTSYVNNYGNIGLELPGNSGSATSSIRYTITGNAGSNTLYLMLDTQSTGSSFTTYTGYAGKTGTINVNNDGGYHTIYGYYGGSSTASGTITITLEKISSTPSTSFINTIMPVCGYSSVDANNAIARIYSESNIQSMYKENNALYINRN